LSSIKELGSNIVHQYFKKDRDGVKILLKVDPIRRLAIELTIPAGGDPTVRDLTFGEDMDKEIATQGFEPTGPFEFNLYDAGLLGS
jgi:hypothetical protein